MKEQYKQISTFHLYISIFTLLIVYTLISCILVYIANGDTFVTNVNSVIDRSNLPTIVIDPGHGGIDGGAVSENGTFEKDLNLKIALKLRSLIELSDIPCIMTREYDAEADFGLKYSFGRKRNDLISRTKICESAENPIFISIHQNKFPSSKYKGLQIFYSRNDDKSALLAETIKNNNKALIDSSNNREIKPAGKEIYVLDNIYSPAVLIECGFLSNAAECELLSSDEYQSKLALMIFKSIVQYIGL